MQLIQALQANVKKLDQLLKQKTLSGSQLAMLRSKNEDSQNLIEQIEKHMTPNESNNQECGLFSLLELKKAEMSKLRMDYQALRAKYEPISEEADFRSAPESGQSDESDGQVESSLRRRAVPLKAKPTDYNSQHGDEAEQPSDEEPATKDTLFGEPKVSPPRALAPSLPIRIVAFDPEEEKKQFMEQIQSISGGIRDLSQQQLEALQS